MDTEGFDAGSLNGSGTESGRGMIELCELNPSQWSTEELRHHHRVLSDMSPWLNAQGNAIHHQIIDEIKRRGSSRSWEEYF